MTKKLCLVIMLLFSSYWVKAQEKTLDTTAIMILDRMSSIFGELNSVGFTSEVSKDVVYAEDFFIKVFTKTDVKIKGPNKFSVRSHGENKEDQYSYNGEKVIYYSFKNNIYTVADAPDNLIETIDWLYNDFGIELTTADFLYPSFSEDFVSNMDHVEFLGIAEINGKAAFHVAGSNESMTIQIWISNDSYYLPIKTVITYFDGAYAHQHQTDFSDWVLNSEYPDAIFEFSTPPGAKQITWMSQN
ncbi:DUF2092 domain-containing protein [Algoriphagus aestuarii]|nr:DUF2092 domain-containing protein [Algoriphagus aestuarii]